MEVTKSKWFELEINAKYQDEFEDACKELDIRYEYIESDVLNNSIFVEVQVEHTQELFYLGQRYQCLK